MNVVAALAEIRAAPTQAEKNLRAASKEYGIAPAVRRLKLQVQRELRKKN